MGKIFFLAVYSLNKIQVKSPFIQVYTTKRKEESD